MGALKYDTHGLHGREPGKSGEKWGRTITKKSFEINNASLQIRSNGELRDFLKANFNTTNFKCPWTNNGVTKGQ